MEQESAAVVVAEERAVAMPVPRAIIAPAGNFQTYMMGLIERARYAVAACDERIAEAQHGVEAAIADDSGEQSRRWRRALAKRLKEKNRRERFLTALEAGYVPLPKMPAIVLERAMHTFPPDVLDAMKEAKEAGVFEEFRIIDGRDAWPGGWPRSWSRRDSTRDPIIVGIIGGEPFAVAWWRPE